MLKWARANDCPWDEWTRAYAAKHGHLEVLKWARENGCPWNEETCAYAADGGHLEVLKWARENGCPWTPDVRVGGEWRPPRDAEVGARERLLLERGTCAYAAKHGQLEVLKWAHENGCPWDWRTCAFAADGGHLEALKCARERLPVGRADAQSRG